MMYGLGNHYTLIIDEFQNVLSINKAIPSEIQDILATYATIIHSYPKIPPCSANWGQET